MEEKQGRLKVAEELRAENVELRRALKETEDRLAVDEEDPDGLILYAQVLRHDASDDGLDSKVDRRSQAHIQVQSRPESRRV